MNVYQVIIRGFAIIYIIGGILWYGSIQDRCSRIAPRPAFNQATSIVATPSSAQGSKPVVMVRSKHAKDYHLFLFRSLAVLEMAVAVFYVTAGLFLLRPFVMTRFIVKGAIWSDIVFKASLLAYMKYCAEPLARLTHNPNVLQLYFSPDDKLSSMLTSSLNGYKFFAGDDMTYLILAGGFLLLSLAFFKLPQVQELLRP